MMDSKTSRNELVKESTRETILAYSKLAVKYALAVSAVVFIVLILWKMPEYQAEHVSRVTKVDTPSLVNEYRDTLVQIIGGTALVLGLIIGWRRISVAEEKVNEIQEAADQWIQFIQDDTEQRLQIAQESMKNLLQTAQEQADNKFKTVQETNKRLIQISERQQLSERFARSIEQLSDAKLSVRLGAIYTLERIARVSPSDHWPIMELLSAYIREQAPSVQQSGSSSNQSLAVSPSSDVATDVQAILTVLGRRKIEERELGALDLAHTNLNQAMLSRARFSAANFTQALLVGSEIIDTNFVGANLSQANLAQANLTGANLRDAVLFEANFAGANLREADFSNALIFRANLSTAFAGSANFSNSNLRETNLRDAVLINANLTATRLCQADLRDTLLSESILTNADLADADLSGAKLNNANLKNTRLKGTKLHGADLSRVTGLTEAQLEDASWSKTTSFPDYIHLPSVRRKKHLPEG
jgi:uncharacterized protein YjbI with pentapeptide repeats